ncbi:ACP S-malonyltransferase [Amycolatopsis sp. NPDC059090]|uniref:ACP S-malonyltransferase n=1 Tax=unclassified Amycolatopsis TaxID=2618356 RepID=UPI00366BF483
MNDKSHRTTALVFPGMGPSRFADVAKFLVSDPVARDLTADVDELLGCSLLDRYYEAADEQSEYADVGFLINCLAMAKWAVAEHGVRPEVCVGASFGSKAAAVWSGALSFADAVRMTIGMARCEQEYFSRSHGDLVTQSFARVPADALAAVRRELDDRGEWHEISCHVDDDFYLLSLREQCLDWFTERLRDIGGLPVYTMRPVMHSSVLGALRERVAREVVAPLGFADPRLPVLSDQDGEPLRTGAQVREMLLDGYVRPVRWPAVVAALKGRGIERLCVSGPDSLFGRVECTVSNFEVLAVNAATMRQSRRSIPATQS